MFVAEGNHANDELTLLKRETQPLVSLNVGQILTEFQRSQNEATQVTATVRMVALEDTRPCNKHVLKVRWRNFHTHQFSPS